MRIDCIKDFFGILNDECKYLVLRNWDNLFDGTLYNSGHEDIDILCENLEEFIRITGATRIHKENNRDNFCVTIGEALVRFDVRWVGDGYYPSEWEARMLDRRIKNMQNVYVLCLEDYFYSLAYHALLQKPSLPPDYLSKLNGMYVSLYNEELHLDEEGIADLLLLYLREHGYSVVLSRDPGVYFNKTTASRMPLKINCLLRYDRGLFRAIQRIKYVFRRIQTRIHKA